MRHFFIILVCLWAATASAQHYIPGDLIGKWQGVDQHRLFAIIEFINDHQADLSSNGPQRVRFNYTADFNRHPFWLDLYRDSAGQRSYLKGLIQFIDKSHLKWQIFPAGNRPNNFIDDSGNLIILTKKRS